MIWERILSINREPRESLTQGHLHNQRSKIALFPTPAFHGQGSEGFQVLAVSPSHGPSEPHHLVSNENAETLPLGKTGKFSFSSQH